MTIIAGSFTDLIQGLAMRGFSLADIYRSPVRLGGRWLCEVRDGRC